MKYLPVLVILSMGPVYAQSAIPIKVSLTDVPTGGVKAELENDSTSVVTAIAFSGPATPRPYLMDSAIQQWHAMNPGQSFSMHFGDAKPPLELRAAILADGRTFGDAATIQTLLAKRRATLQALGIILQHLPSSSAIPPGPLIPIYRSYKVQQLSGLADGDPVKLAIMNANGWVERQVQKMAGERADAIVTAIASQVHDWQTALKRSLPSLE